MMSGTNKEKALHCITDFAEIYSTGLVYNTYEYQFFSFSQLVPKLLTPKKCKFLESYNSQTINIRHIMLYVFGNGIYL